MYWIHLEDILIGQIKMLKVTMSTNHIRNEIGFL